MKDFERLKSNIKKMFVSNKKGIIVFGGNNTFNVNNSKEKDELTDLPEKEKRKTSKWGYYLGIGASLATIIGLIITIVNMKTITSMELNITESKMIAGEKIQLVANALCSNGSSVDQIKWISSDSSVVQVNENGEIVALQPGEAVVTAAAKVWNDSKSISCQIKVLAPPSGYSIALGAYEVYLYEKFEVTVLPYGDDITEIWLTVKAPSGEEQPPLLMDISGKGVYQIYKETGTWEISAIIKNRAGEYVASIPEDIVYIKVN